MALVVGVDACRGGWFAVVTEHGRFVDAQFGATLAELLAGFHGASVIAVDIPIGLPAEGVRAADTAARQFVGPRRSSVFSTPTRASLGASSYAEARLVLPSLSAQSFALGRKILEVERSLEERICEVHPEVSFAAVAGQHLKYPKRSWNGQMERRRLLKAAGIELPDVFAGGEAAADDVLDAAVAAWSADRKACGKAQTLPVDPPEQDRRPVAIWY